MALLEKTTRDTRRKTIADEAITDDAVVAIVNMVFDKATDPSTITQKEIVKILLNTKLGNKTMARVVNLILPTAKATANSIASLIKHIRKSTVDIDVLLLEIEKDIQNA